MILPMLNVNGLLVIPSRKFTLVMMTRGSDHETLAAGLVLRVVGIDAVETKCSSNHQVFHRSVLLRWMVTALKNKDFECCLVQDIARATRIEYIVHVTAKSKPTAQEHGVLLLSTLAVLDYYGGRSGMVFIVGGCFDFVAFQVES